MLCNARGYCTNVFCRARGLGSKTVINNCSKVILTKNMQGMRGVNYIRFYALLSNAFPIIFGCYSIDFLKNSVGIL